MERFFRIDPAGEDPGRLLDPDRQRSEPWNGTIYGRCVKCAGEGSTEHRCESCSDGGPDPGCPACGGKVSYRARCPACQGSGEVDDSCRDGVSVFPDESGLYRYMVRRGADLVDSVVVELEGRPTEDEDFDADEGALLVRPTRIVDCREPDWDQIEALRRNPAA